MSLPAHLEFRLGVAPNKAGARIILPSGEFIIFFSEAELMELASQALAARDMLVKRKDSVN